MSFQLVSIIIPVYNGEKYIERCLKSVCDQTYPNLQIIVVDDGSTDQTKKIVETAAERDPRMELYTKENEGVSSARNFGIKKVRGEFVCFVDADDWVNPCFIEDNAAIMHEKSVDLVINDFFFETQKEKRYCRVMRTEAGIVAPDAVRTQTIVSDDLNSMGICLFSADIIKENKLECPTGITNGEDNIFNIQYVDKISCAYYTNKAYYHYEMHAGSGCRHLHGNQLSMYETQFEIKKAYMKKWDLESKSNTLQLLQLAGTHLAGFALMAQREFDRQGYYKWLDELYGLNCFRELEENKHSLSYKSVPRSYRILLRCLLSKRHLCSYVYCKALNGLL